LTPGPGNSICSRCNHKKKKKKKKKEGKKERKEGRKKERKKGDEEFPSWLSGNESD